MNFRARSLTEKALGELLLQRRDGWRLLPLPLDPPSREVSRLQSEWKANQLRQPAEDRQAVP